MSWGQCGDGAGRFHACAEDVDLPTVAAGYAVGLAQRDPFVGGNRRVSDVLCRGFLLLNGWDLVGLLVERCRVFAALATDRIDEAALVSWLRDHSWADGV